MPRTETDPLARLPAEIAALSRTEAMADLIIARRMRVLPPPLLSPGFDIRAEWGYAAYLLTARLARNE